MLAVNFLEETGTGAQSIWTPIVILGWFFLMTLVGWQVSRRNAMKAVSPQARHTSEPGNPPLEFDNH